MRGKRAFGAFLALALLGLVGPNRAGAWPLFGPYKDCPKPCYSCLHYWAPTLYRVKAFCHPSQVSVYPRPRDLPAEPSFEIYKFPCPAIPPGSVPYYKTNPPARDLSASEEPEKNEDKKTPVPEKK